MILQDRRKPVYQGAGNSAPAKCHQVKQHPFYFTYTEVLELILLSRFRRRGATSVVAQSSQQEMEVVSRHMTHTPSTSQRYAVPFDY